MRFAERMLELRYYITVLMFTGSVFLVFTPTVFAQDERPDEEAYEIIIEEVIVTGTRIKRRDYTSPSPLTKQMGQSPFPFIG